MDAPARRYCPRDLRPEIQDFARISSIACCFFASSPLFPRHSVQKPAQLFRRSSRAIRSCAHVCSTAMGCRRCAVSWTYALRDPPCGRARWQGSEVAHYSASRQKARPPLATLLRSRERAKARPLLLPPARSRWPVQERRKPRQGTRPCLRLTVQRAATRPTS